MADRVQASNSDPPATVSGPVTKGRENWSSACNVPNTLCVIRLLGSLGLVYLALADRPTAFLWLYVFLLATDWIDGKLAILLHQRTVFGARLDSAADAALYTALLFGFCWLKWDFVLEQTWWIFGALASYAVTTGAGLLKFKRMPSYHTWAAKASNHLVLIAVICVFTNWAVWPFHVAMTWVIITNLEATAITLVLRHWRADISSIYHVVRGRTSVS